MGATVLTGVADVAVGLMLMTMLREGAADAIGDAAFVAREAVVGMAVYSARAMLHGKGHDVWEMVAENISQGKKPRVQT